MREIVFDTETTGRDPRTGDRLVELACLELIDLAPTGQTFHRYCNPERDMPYEAQRIHGLSAAFLADKPLFSSADVVDRFLEFVGDAPLVAHNAEFDRGFLNAELTRCGRASLPQERFVDTLVLARKRFPGQANSLDALCKRFNVSLSTRRLHGALVDVRLLAEVYLELRGGRERSLAFEEVVEAAGEVVPRALQRPAARRRPAPLPLLSTAEERAAHGEFIASLGPAALWTSLGLLGEQAALQEPHHDKVA